MTATLAAAFGLGLIAPTAPAPPTPVSTGTGGVAGVHVPTGGAIRRLDDGRSRERRIRGAARSTVGAARDRGAIGSGSRRFRVARSDVQARLVVPDGMHGGNRETRGFAQCHARRPASADLQEAEAIRSALAAPLHPEAVKYLIERGRS